MFTNKSDNFPVGLSEQNADGFLYKVVTTSASFPGRGKSLNLTAALTDWCGKTSPNAWLRGFTLSCSTINKCYLTPSCTFIFYSDFLFFWDLHSYHKRSLVIQVQVKLCVPLSSRFQTTLILAKPSFIKCHHAYCTPIFTQSYWIQ